MAVDDWEAILYLVKSPQVAPRSITVTGVGEAHCQPGVKKLSKSISRQKPRFKMCPNPKA